MARHDSDETAATASWRTTLRQLVVFALVGGAFNVVYVAVFVVLRFVVGPQWANAVALVLSTVAATWGHRRVTFGVHSSAHTRAHQTAGLVLLGFGLAVTAAALWLLDVVVGQPTRWQELWVLVVANLGIGLVRFVVLRAVVLPGRPLLGTSG